MKRFIYIVALFALAVAAIPSAFAADECLASVPSDWDNVNQKWMSSEVMKFDVAEKVICDRHIDFSMRYTRFECQAGGSWKAVDTGWHTSRSICPEVSTCGYIVDGSAKYAISGKAFKCTKWVPFYGINYKLGRYCNNGIWNSIPSEL